METNTQISCATNDELIAMYGNESYTPDYIQLIKRELAKRHLLVSREGSPMFTANWIRRNKKKENRKKEPLLCALHGKHIFNHSLSQVFTHGRCEDCPPFEGVAYLHD